MKQSDKTFLPEGYEIVSAEERAEMGVVWPPRALGMLQLLLVLLGIWGVLLFD